MRTAQADLATPARIRLAAVGLFGLHGFDIGLRTIADEAGVSLGLIRHHFGSKAGLRQACDDYVLGEIRRLQEEQALASQPASVMLEHVSSMDEYQPLVRYMVQALRAGGEMAAAFLERMIADSEVYLEQGVAAGTIKPSIDPAARARFLVMISIGALVLQYSLAPQESAGETWRRYSETTTLPALELYAQGLMTDRSMLEAYLDYVKDPPAQTERGAGS